MDVEKTMQFILEQQASYAARHDADMEAIRRTLLKVVEFEVRHSEDVEKHERALGDLLKMHQINAKEIRSLAQEGRETRKILRDFIRSLRGSPGNGKNGSSHKK